MAGCLMTVYSEMAGIDESWGICRSIGGTCDYVTEMAVTLKNRKMVVNLETVNTLTVMVGSVAG